MPRVDCTGPLGLLHQIIVAVKAGHQQEALQPSSWCGCSREPQVTGCHLSQPRAVSVVLHRILLWAAEIAAIPPATKAMLCNPAIEQGPYDTKLTAWLSLSSESAEVVDNAAGPPSR